MENSQLIDENLLSEMQKYYDKGNSIAEVARKFNSTYSRLKGLQRNGLMKFRENNHSNQYCFKVPDKETLKAIQSYYDNLYSLRDIEKEFKISYMRLVTLNKRGFLNFDNSEERRNRLVRKKSKGRKHSEETKKRISENRKKWIKENPDKSPYLMSHKSRGETYPERYFREWLEKENIPFQQEYRFKLFAFDFLVNERVDLEIDGGQHKNDKRIIEHDIKRDTKTQEAGFVVYRIEWCNYQRLTHEEKEKFLMELKKFLLNVDSPVPEFVIKKRTRTYNVKEKKNYELFVHHKVDTRLYQYDYCSFMVLEMFKNGKTMEEIADIFDVSRSTVSRWIHGSCEGESLKKVLDVNKGKHGSTKHKIIKVSLEQKQQALSLLKQGMSYVQVGKKFKVSDNAIRKWVKSLGLDPKHFGRDGKKNKF